MASKVVPFSGNRHNVPLQLSKWLQKRPFLWIKVKPRYDEAQLPPLSAKVSFFRIEQADLMLLGNNQRLSNSVFSVSSYILVLR